MIKSIEENLEAIVRLCSTHNVQSLEIFGSALEDARFDETTSDLDFLVEFLPLEPVHHAKSYFSLLKCLRDLFDRKVDLVESRAIKNPYFLEAINKQREQIYAA